MSAVEVIGGRFGKMGSGVMTSTLLMFVTTSSLLSIIPILAVICAIIVILWIGTIFELGKEYHAALDKRKESEAA